MGNLWLTCTLLLALIATVQSQGVSECLAYSQAPKVAAKVAALTTQSGSPFAGVTTAAGITAALTQLVAVTNTLATPPDSIYVGTSTHDWYAINYIGGTSWTLQAVNPALYGDSKQRTLYLDISDGTTFNFAAATVGAAYDPVSRPWYTAVEGWSTYSFFSNGRNGSTYHKPFAGGVIGADRNFLEPCGICWESSLALSIASLLKNGPAQAAKERADWKTIIRSIQTIYTTLKNSYLPAAEIGTGDGSFYSVSDCKIDPSQCSGFNTPYVAQVSAPGLTPVGTVYIYPLSADGTIGAQAGSFSYDPRVRPWYVLANGWSVSYPFALGSSLSARTYALQFNGGVIGVDRIDAEPCNGCEAPTPSPTAPPTSCASNNAININFAGILAGR